MMLYEIAIAAIRNIPTYVRKIMVQHHQHSCRSCCRRIQLVVVELLFMVWMQCIYSSKPVFCTTTRLSILKNSKQYHQQQQQLRRRRRQTKRNYFSTTIVQQNTTTTPYDDTNDDEQHQPSNKTVIHPFLGPLIEADNAPVIIPLTKYEIPNNLQYVGLELDIVPVGFQRLRWALLSRNSLFVTEGWYKNAEHYSNVEVKEWDKYSNQIGEPTNAHSPNNIPNHPFIGAQKDCQYLMPKSRFISAMMCYETHTILEYNDNCFCLRKQGMSLCFESNSIDDNQNY